MRFLVVFVRMDESFCLCAASLSVCVCVCVPVFFFIIIVFTISTIANQSVGLSLFRLLNKADPQRYQYVVANLYTDLAGALTLAAAASV